MTCRVEQCGNRALAKGLCGKHYQRWKRHGDPVRETNYRPRGMSVPDSFAYFPKHRNGNCLIWDGNKDGNGYGCFNSMGTVYLAHRVAYELAHGPIPQDSEIDHTCRVRACVNPDHLRAVNHIENAQNRDPRRGVTFHAASGLWRARVRSRGEVVYYREFKTEHEARQAIREARNQILTHNDRDRV